MKPTTAELEILSALWRTGPATVRQVQEAIGREQAYTTVLKLLQIMTEKGLVERSEDNRAHIYRAAQSKGATQTRLVEDLVERAFGGSAASLALQALSRKRATPEEIAEIRRLLDEHERNSKWKPQSR